MVQPNNRREKKGNTYNRSSARQRTERSSVSVPIFVDSTESVKALIIISSGLRFHSLYFNTKGQHLIEFAADLVHRFISPATVCSSPLKSLKNIYTTSDKAILKNGQVGSFGDGGSSEYLLLSPNFRYVTLT